MRHRCQQPVRKQLTVGVRSVRYPSRRRLLWSIILKICIRRLSFLYTHNRRFKMATTTIALFIILSSTALVVGWQYGRDVYSQPQDIAENSSSSAAAAMTSSGTDTNTDNLNGSLIYETNSSSLYPNDLPLSSVSQIATLQSSAITTGSLTATSLVPASTTQMTAAAPTPTTATSTAKATATTAAAAASATTIATTRALVTTFPGIARAISDRWQFPLKREPETPVYGEFGYARTSKRLHAGIDLYAPSGTPVYAMTDGQVQNIEIFYNNLMEIAVANHDGTTIRYCELMPLVKIGDTVSQGQMIGKLRCNYDGTCMLHLEIYATVRSAPLTQTDNLTNYLYVPIGKKPYVRRCDLVDPSAVYSLRRY